MTRGGLDSIANARALYYDFFAGFFLYELLQTRKDVFLDQIKLLKANALDEGDLAHFELLENELSLHGVHRILEEYTYAFILPFIPTGSEPPVSKKKSQVRPNAQVMLYLSHYLEGCLNGKSLLKARKLTKQTTFRINDQTCKESEEHLGFLLLLMRHLLLSEHLEDKNLLKEVTLELVLPLGRFVTEALAQREDLNFYPSVSELLAHFLEFESSLW